METVSTQRGRQRQGIMGKKSVMTSCRHWKAIRTKFSLKINYIIKKITVEKEYILPMVIRNGADNIQD